MIKKITTTAYVDSDTDQEYVFEPVEDTILLKEITHKENEKIEKGKKGFELRYLTVDNDPVSPDEYGDDGLFLVHYHRQFWIERKECPKEVLGYLYTQNADAYDKENAEKLLKTHWFFSVAAYIHGGVALALDGSKFPDQQWDVSHVGAVLVSKEEFPKQKKARKTAESLVASWNEYLSGDVYCIVKEILDENREMIDYDVVGGYYGEEYAKKALKTDI